jgi:hypothetical protein
MNDFSLQQPVERILRYWWFILVFCMLGGLTGWLINDIQPPVYEAEARFHLYLDLVRTGKIDRLDEDVLMQTAGWLMSTPEVLDEVITQATLQGIQVDPQKKLEIFIPEQRGEVWILRIRYSDPQAAAALANLWAEIGGKNLETALTHAERAESYRHYLEAQESCLLQAYVSEPAASQCAANNIQAIQENLEATGTLYLYEKSMARGVSPAIDFSFEKQAEVPSTAVRFQRSTLILAGAAIGLLLAGWITSAGLPDRIRKMRRER